MRYIYWPVKSRRLGLSLGLSLTPYKICTFDCVYCQLGLTTDKTDKRQEYIKIDEILAEFKSWVDNNPQELEFLNYVTVSGSGEPTLNLRISELISRIKEVVSVPIAVITNSSLLLSPHLRKELLGASLIVPSLDAVSQEVFEKIDRPLAGLRVEDIIEGLVALRKEFKGKIWLEIMLAKGINDDLRHIKKFKDVLERIKADKIQLNSPVRTPAEANILPVAKAKLNKIKEMLGDKCEIL